MTTQPRGMAAFTIVWFGQVVSLLGTAMTGFALTIWAWRVTGSAESLALVGFFSFTPMVVFGPVAGALVDRWNRKTVMMISDLASGLASIAVFALYLTGNLQIWHLYVTGAFSGIFQAFQWPAYSAAISTMLPKEHYARAQGMMGIAEFGSNIVAPALAAALLLIIDIQGILVIDVVTFIFAVGALAFVAIPQPPVSAEGAAARGNLAQESLFGFGYIFARPSLLGLQLVFFFGNLMSSLGFTILAPMVLARSATGQDAYVLGAVQTAAGIGGLVGSLALSAWGGPKRRVHGVLFGHILAGLFGMVLMGLGRDLPVWAVSSFLGMLILPALNGSNQAIWQAKVPPDLQGRVFAVRRLIAQISAPIAMLIAGFSAERFFEPGMQAGGALVPLFGALVGVGTGAGMAVLMIIGGLGSALAGVVGYLVPAIRNAEDLLPDHDAVPHDAVSDGSPTPA